MFEKPIERRREATRREIVDAAWTLCRARGLTGLSLRDLAAAVGLRAPSLYSYFGSKDAIYDAMFAEGQAQLAERFSEIERERATRADLRHGARVFLEFCTSDPIRYQLMFQRTIPGFEPSPDAYAPAVRFIERTAASLRSAGATEPAHLDLWTALVTGIVAQQLANEPGGDRWARLLDDAVDMFCDHTGIPP